MATRVLPAVASQKQGSGAIRAFVEMIRRCCSTVLVHRFDVGGVATAEEQHECEEYSPFQGRDGLEGCSVTDLVSALSRKRTVVTPCVSANKASSPDVKAKW